MAQCFHMLVSAIENIGTVTSGFKLNHLDICVHCCTLLAGSHSTDHVIKNGVSLWTKGSNVEKMHQIYVD